MNGQYVIYPLHLGDIDRQKTSMAYMRDPGKVLKFPVLAWYLTDGEHHVLVDTGGNAPEQSAKHMPYARTPQQDPVAALARLNVKPEDIEHVILTHLHWDHADNVSLFPNATCYVQRRELQYAAAPLSAHIFSYHTRQIFQTDYRVLDKECAILQGISVLQTPGHSPGSQSVQVDTAAGRYLITGDLVTLYECVEKLPYVPNGQHLDLVEYYDVLERVMQLGYTLLPGHEPQVLQQSCYPPK